MKLGRTLTVFLTGVVTGVLLAPKKGEQTREDIVSFYNDARKEFEKNWENSSEILKDVAARVKDFTDKAFVELENYRQQIASEAEASSRHNPSERSEEESSRNDNENTYGG